MLGLRGLMWEQIGRAMRGPLPKEEYIRSLVGDNITVVTSPEQEVIGILYVDEETFRVGDTLFRAEDVATFAYSLFAAPIFVLRSTE